MPDNLPLIIKSIIEELGKFMQVDRSYIFDFDLERQTLSNTFEWCAEGVSPQIENIQNFPFLSIPWWMKKINSNQEIILDQLSDLPLNATEEKEILSSQEIKSLLVVPFFHQDQAIGYIGFDMVKDSKHWEKESINLLRLVSAMIISTRDRFRNNL